LAKRGDVTTRSLACFAPIAVLHKTPLQDPPLHVNANSCEKG